MSATASVNPVARAIKAILIVQLGMAVFLFGRDMIGSWSGFGFAPRAPSLDAPVRPGDQTRRFDPRDLPQRDIPDSRPFPATPNMPDRLAFEIIDVEDGDRVLTLTGAIAPGDARRLTEFLEPLAEPIKTAFLNSPGGSVSDALQIGTLLREAEMNTEMAAGDICMSACPYVLSAGVERRVAEGAFVGVHQHYFEENTALPAFLIVEDIQRGQGEVMTYLAEMGVDPLLMQHALVTPPEAIYVFLREELETYRIITE